MDPNIELEPDVESLFESKQFTIKKDTWVYDQFEILELLGRGKFGEVKKCKEKSTGLILAAKFLSIRREQQKKDVLNEIEVMKSLKHPRLMQLYDVYENSSKKQMCLIMELIDGGELFERLVDDSFVLTEQLCKLYILQISEGLRFMHNLNILHLDLKPENILCVSKEGHRLKIIDFGLARSINPNQTLKVFCGTPEFVAPEVVNYEKIGFETDMWSLGVICYVLLSGISPFMGDNDAETFSNITRAEFDFDDEAFEDISEEAKDFISKLLVKDRRKRMLVSDCLNHIWLSKKPKLEDKIINTKNLKRFVIRRRWQKAVNAILALKRMGVNL